MLRLIVRRLLTGIPLIFLVLIVNFMLIHIAPGDPAAMIAGPDAPPEYVMELKNEMGLDKPLHEQLIIYLREVLSGNLGYSWEHRRDILDLILEKLAATLLLMSISMSISIAAGIFLGVMSSKKPYSKQDNIFQAISLICYSMPEFWLGLMFILIFSFYLGLFPIQGMMTVGVTGVSHWLDVAWHLILPASVLGLARLAAYSRLTRASMLEALGQDYIVTAWSKGCSPRAVFYKHALRNALLPIVTRIGMEFRRLFTGAILVETVFSWPGIGTLMFDSIYARDHNTLLGIFFIVSVLVILGNLIADILYSYLDPRIRQERAT